MKNAVIALVGVFSLTNAAFSSTEVVCDIRVNGTTDRFTYAADGNWINQRVAQLEAKGKDVTITLLAASSAGAANSSDGDGMSAYHLR